MLSTFMKDYDELCLKYEATCEIAKNLRDMGVDISIIKEATKLPEKVIREL